MYLLPVAMAQSFCDDNATRYILPVLWMASCLPIIGQAKATPIGVYSVIHQKVEPYVAKSDVYDCLV